MSTSLVIPIIVFVLIKASMLGATSSVSCLTTTNKVVWGRTSTEVNLLSRILFRISYGLIWKLARGYMPMTES
jgi:hypothetical protein